MADLQGMLLLPLQTPLNGAFQAPPILRLLLHSANAPLVCNYGGCFDMPSGRWWHGPGFRDSGKQESPGVGAVQRVQQ